MSEITMHEEVGPDYLAPVRPHAEFDRYNQWRTLKIVRQDLLASFRTIDYRRGVRPIRLFGRQMVMVNSPEAIREVMVTDHENFERKSPQMRRALEFLLGDGLFISDGETWAHRRPLVADIVHKNQVPKFAPVIVETARELADEWSAADPTAPTDMLKEMACMAAEIVSRTVFGVKLGRQRAIEVVDGFADYQAHIDSFNLGYLMGFDDGLPVFKGLRLRAAVRRVHKVVNQVIDAQMHGHGEHQTMLELLQRRQEKNPTASIGRDALRNESATLFMAGYETTATALAWSWYLLAKAPWAQAKLHEEIARVCGDRPVEAEDAPKLDYARAIIEETLRLYPPVPILSRQAKGKVKVGGVEIEKAALIIVSPWTIHRSPDIWDEPEKFKPERFLGDRPKPYTYIPFAVGPRICPGMNFGLTEAILCLATLAQRFAPTLSPDHMVETRCRLTLRPHNLRMQLRPRADA